jgi:ubiquinone/menaquinone biosynthesis C-methylase UbiE
MSDRPPQTRPEDVFSRRAPFYATSKVHDDKETLSWLVEAASPRPDDLALDVGTGAGHTAMALAPLVRRVEAIDLTEEMLDEARKLSKQRELRNIAFHKGDAMALPYPDGTFDVVTCRRAAHHFGDVRKALSEMGRVLKIGGRLVIDDRSIPEDDEIDRLINSLDVLHDPSHVRDYRESEWRNFIAMMGLELVAVRLYRKRMPLSHFTKMVDSETAKRMGELLEITSPHAKREMRVEMSDHGLVMDNCFILIAAIKPK